MAITSDPDGPGTLARPLHALPHLLVALSSHGLGHLAQVAPVLNQLHRRLPGLRLTLRTALSRERLQERIEAPFSLQPVADDFGMLQHNALELKLEASLQRYTTLHSSWEQHVSRVAAELESVAPDLVFADVPYLTLAAASRVGIPAVAMCSLNWAAIIEGCLGGYASVDRLLQPMLDAYQSAEVFICPEPSMPMAGLDNLCHVGVVATVAENRRAALLAKGLVTNQRLVLLAMGGFEHRLPVERWPRRQDLRYLVPASWQLERDDCLEIESTGLSFAELLASSDVVVTKPGYGTFTEAVCSGVAVMYVRRGNWPEEPALIDWIQRHGRSVEIGRVALERGEHLAEIEALLRQPAAPRPECEGAAEVATLLQRRLGGELRSDA